MTAMATENDSSTMDGSSKARTRVAVIGAGAAGLAAALHLGLESPGEFDVTLMESSDRIGGHACSLYTKLDGEMVSVELGVTLVFEFYEVLRHLAKYVGTDLQLFLPEINVENPSVWKKIKIFMTTMRTGLGFRVIFKPWFYHLIYDIMRFHFTTPKFSNLHDDDPRKYMVTLDEYLQENGYGKAIQDLIIYPNLDFLYICRATRSSESTAHYAVKLLQAIIGGVTIRLAKGGIQKHMDRFAAKLAKDVKIEKNTRVVSVKNEGCEWTVEDCTGKIRRFDKVLFAVNPSVTKKLLGESATEEENELLSLFDEHTMTVECSTHIGDKNLELLDLNPSIKTAGFGWDIQGFPLSEIHYPTFLYNRIGGYPLDELILLSTPDLVPPGFKTVQRVDFNICSYVPPAAYVAQGKLLGELNGKRGIYFAGGWLGAYTHEDALRSGLIAAYDINKRESSWTPPSFNPKMKRLQCVAWSQSEVKRYNFFLSEGIPLESLPMLIRPIVRHSLGRVHQFLRDSVQKGCITLVLPDNTCRSFGTSALKMDHLTLRVFDWNFLVRAAIDFHSGFVDSYVEGEIAFGGDKGSFHNYGNELERFFQLLNIKQDCESQKLGMLRTFDVISTAEFLISAIMSIAALLYCIISMRNTGIQRVQKGFKARYAKIGNPIQEVDLRDAFDNAAVLKDVDKFIERAELKPDHYVLDIHCGCGTACIRAAETIGCRVIGITDSLEFKHLAEEIVLKKGLSHLVQIYVANDYMPFAIQREKEFDKVISYEMIDYMADKCRSPDFFCAIHKLLKPGGQLIFEATTFQNESYNDCLPHNFIMNGSGVYTGMGCNTVPFYLDLAAKNNFSLSSIDKAPIEGYSHVLREGRRIFNEAKNANKIRKLGYNSYLIRFCTYNFVRCNVGLEKSINRLVFKFNT